MYEEEKNQLKNKLKKSLGGDEIYEDLEKVAEKWGEVKKERILQELKRNYEIGVPIDKMQETITLCISSVSLILLTLTFAYGEGFFREILGGDIFVRGVLLILVFLFCSAEIFCLRSYKRKRQLKILIDFLETFKQKQEVVEKESITR
ncbi:MAG: hypothetical protein NC123_00695 [Butyrivibrio sp.]|nr:hypothetical protein [Acetatifactor muris]MCM1558053.1 hypothetical protein [Butyrivibrio sp.]